MESRSSPHSAKKPMEPVTRFADGDDGTLLALPLPASAPTVPPAGTDSTTTGSGNHVCQVSVNSSPPPRQASPLVVVATPQHQRQQQPEQPLPSSSSPTHDVLSSLQGMTPIHQLTPTTAPSTSNATHTAAAATTTTTTTTITTTTNTGLVTACASGGLTPSPATDRTWNGGGQASQLSRSSGGDGGGGVLFSPTYPIISGSRSGMNEGGGDDADTVEGGDTSAWLRRGLHVASQPFRKGSCFSFGDSDVDDVDPTADTFTTPPSANAIAAAMLVSGDDRLPTPSTGDADDARYMGTASSRNYAAMTAATDPAAGARKGIAAASLTILGLTSHCSPVASALSRAGLHSIRPALPSTGSHSAVLTHAEEQYRRAVARTLGLPMSTKARGVFTYTSPVHAATSAIVGARPPPALATTRPAAAASTATAASAAAGTVPGSSALSPGSNSMVDHERSPSQVRGGVAVEAEEGVNPYGECVTPPRMPSPGSLTTPVRDRGIHAHITGLENAVGLQLDRTLPLTFPMAPASLRTPEHLSVDAASSAGGGGGGGAATPRHHHESSRHERIGGGRLCLGEDGASNGDDKGDGEDGEEGLRRMECYPSDRGRLGASDYGIRRASRSFASSLATLDDAASLTTTPATTAAAATAAASMGRFAAFSVPPAMPSPGPTVLRTPVRHEDNGLCAASGWSPMGPLASVGRSPCGGGSRRAAGYHYSSNSGVGIGESRLSSASISPLANYMLGTSTGWDRSAGGDMYMTPPSVGVVPGLELNGAGRGIWLPGPSSPPHTSSRPLDSSRDRHHMTSGVGAAGAATAAVTPPPPSVAVMTAAAAATSASSGGPRPFSVERRLNVRTLALRACESPLFWGCFGLLVALRDGVHVLSTDVITGAERVLRLYATGRGVENDPARTAATAAVNSDGDIGEDEDVDGEEGGPRVTAVTSTTYLGECDGYASMAACRTNGGEACGSAAEAACQGSVTYVVVGLSSGGVVVYGYWLCTRTSAALRERQQHQQRTPFRHLDGGPRIALPPPPLPLYDHPDLVGLPLFEHTLPGDGSTISALHVVGHTLYVGTMAGRLSLYDLRHTASAPPVAATATAPSNSESSMVNAAAVGSPTPSSSSMPPTPPRPVWVPPQHRLRAPTLTRTPRAGSLGGVNSATSVPPHAGGAGGGMPMLPCALPPSTTNIGLRADFHSHSQRPPLHTPPSLAALVVSNRQHLPGSVRSDPSPAGSTERGGGGGGAHGSMNTNEGAIGVGGCGVLFGEGHGVAGKSLDNSINTTFSGRSVSVGDEGLHAGFSSVDTAAVTATHAGTADTATSKAAIIAAAADSIHSNGHVKSADVTLDDSAALREVTRTLSRLVIATRPIHIAVGESIYSIVATLDRDRIAVGTTHRLLIYHASQLIDAAASVLAAAASAASATGAITGDVEDQGEIRLPSPTPLVVLRHAAWPVRAFDWLRPPMPRAVASFPTASTTRHSSLYDMLARSPVGVAPTHTDPMPSGAIGESTAHPAGGWIAPSASRASPVHCPSGGGGTGGNAISGGFVASRSAARVGIWSSPMLVFAGGRDASELCVFSMAAQRIVSRRAVCCPIHLVRCSPFTCDVVVCRHVGMERHLRSFWRPGRNASASSSANHTATAAAPAATTVATDALPSVHARTASAEPWAVVSPHPRTPVTRVASPLPPPPPPVSVPVGPVSALDGASLHLFEIVLPGITHSGGVGGGSDDEANEGDPDDDLLSDLKWDSDSEDRGEDDEEKGRNGNGSCFGDAAGLSPYSCPTDPHTVDEDASSGSARANSATSPIRTAAGGRLTASMTTARTAGAAASLSSREPSPRVAAASMLTPAPPTLRSQRLHHHHNVSGAVAVTSSRNSNRASAPIIRLRGFSATANGAAAAGPGGGVTGGTGAAAARGVGAEDAVYAIFSPDGARFATAGPGTSLDRHASIWDPLCIGDDARKGRVMIAAAAAASASAARSMSAGAGGAVNTTRSLLSHGAGSPMGSHVGLIDGLPGIARIPQPLLQPTTADFAAHSVLR